MSTTQQPRFYMLIGLPGSGKSFWTANYRKTCDHPPVVISTDSQIDAWAAINGITYSEAFGQLSFKTMKREARRQLAEALAADQDIIIDQTNMSLKSRREKLVMVPPHYLKTAVVFSIPDPMLRQRLDERAKAIGKIIPDTVIEAMARKYQPPTTAEFDKIVWVTS